MRRGVAYVSPYHEQSVGDLIKLCLVSMPLHCPRAVDVGVSTRLSTCAITDGGTRRERTHVRGHLITVASRPRVFGMALPS
jgi:hypothetical protein